MGGGGCLACSWCRQGLKEQHTHEAAQRCSCAVVGIGGWSCQALFEGCWCWHVGAAEPALYAGARSFACLQLVAGKVRERDPCRRVGSKVRVEVLYCEGVDGGPGLRPAGSRTLACVRPLSLQQGAAAGVSKVRGKQQPQETGHRVGDFPGLE